MYLKKDLPSKRPAIRVTTTVVCLVLLAAATRARAVQYNVTNLGTLGGTSSTATAINNLGQVVGQAATTSNAAFHATLYSGTGSDNIDLGNLGGSVNNTSLALGINDAGQIVGESAIGFTKATLFSGTGTENTDLGNLPGSGGSFGQAINNSGVMVGGAGKAVRYSGTGSDNTDLGTLGGASSFAFAINSAGTIVGRADNASSGNRATRFGGSGTPSNMDLGTILTGTVSTAFGVNDLGQVVGSGGIDVSPTAHHAILFSGTGSGNTDLGTLGGTGTSSHAYAINSAGQIVGNSQFATGNFNFHAFLYHGGSMSDLNVLIPGDSGVNQIRLNDTSGRALGRSINEFGQIAAVGNVSGQGERGLRLDPVDPLTTTSGGGASLNIKFISEMLYSQFAPAADPSNFGTVVELLGGTAGSGGPGVFGLNRDVGINFLPPNPIRTASDIVTLTGTQSDTFVLQLSYDESTAVTLFGSEAEARLGWLDGADWVLAIDGNTGGTPTFVEGAWNAGHTLGFHGVDTSANTVWAVLNHNSDFAAIGVPGASLLGDYNNNGMIDAADYTVWRDALSAGSTSLTNDPTPGVVDESDFDYWRAHFGETLGSGAGAGATGSASAAVPEPSSLLLLLLGVVGSAKCRNWRRR